MLWLIHSTTDPRIIRNGQRNSINCNTECNTLSNYTHTHTHHIRAVVFRYCSCTGCNYNWSLLLLSGNVPQVGGGGGREERGRKEGED